jgi:transcriptional regulator with XRE-family HTH domain
MKGTKSSPKALTDGARMILRLRRSLKLSQSELGAKVGASAMAISRWERGEAQPHAGAYIQLGKLAGDPLCWSFWGRVGLSTSDVILVLSKARRRFFSQRAAPLLVVHAGAQRKCAPESESLVAIPILPVSAATPGDRGDKVSDLTHLRPEAMLAAPQEWCPNPSSTVSLRVKGNSMSPLILDGYVIAVDTSCVLHDDLVGQIVVASHIEKGLLVSRLVRFDHTDVLVSDHREYESVSLVTPSGWRVLGKVLWWIGQAR